MTLRGETDAPAGPTSSDAPVFAKDRDRAVGRNTAAVPQDQQAAGPFSDVKAETRRCGWLRSASSRLRSSWNAPDQIAPVPTRERMWRRREAKRTKTDA